MWFFKTLRPLFSFGVSSNSLGPIKGKEQGQGGKKIMEMGKKNGMGEGGEERGEKERGREEGRRDMRYRRGEVGDEEGM